MDLVSDGWEQRAQRAVNAIRGTAFLFLDADFVVRWTNASFPRIFGYDPLGESALGFLHPDDVRFAVNVLQHHRVEAQDAPTRTVLDRRITEELSQARAQVRIRSTTTPWVEVTVSIDNLLATQGIGGLLVRIDRLRDQFPLSAAVDLLAREAPVNETLKQLSEYCVLDGDAFVPPVNIIVWRDHDGEHRTTTTLDDDETIHAFSHPSIFVPHLKSAEATVLVDDITYEPAQTLAKTFGFRSVWIIPAIDDSGIHLGVILTWSSIGQERTLRPDMHLSIGSKMIKLALIEHRRFHQLRSAVRTDELTQVHNRVGFTEYLKAVTDRNTYPVGALFVDLDDFKQINDQFGHPTGDFVLAEVAGRLSRACRSSDVVARLGGDEFVLITTGLKDTAELQVVADRLIAAIAEPISTEAGMLAVTASIGISLALDADSLELLIQRADDALYLAKKSGKGQSFSLTD